MSGTGSHVRHRVPDLQADTRKRRLIVLHVRHRVACQAQGRMSGTGVACQARGWTSGTGLDLRHGVPDLQARRGLNDARAAPKPLYTATASAVTPNSMIAVHLHSKTYIRLQAEHPLRRPDMLATALPRRPFFRRIVLDRCPSHSTRSAPKMNTTANNTTEFVFVCSPDYWRYLFLSMRSLLASNPAIDNIAVFVTGSAAQSRTLQARVRDQRVRFYPVPDIGAGHWCTNKIHVCRSSAHRVVFLDVDVAVLQPIEPLWQGREEDLIARLADVTYTKRWRADKWLAALAAAGAPPYPFYSNGFVIFQNGAHRRVAQRWLDTTRRILRGELPLPANRFAEMYGLSIAASVENLTCSNMPEKAHGYAFMGEPSDGVTVHHFGTPMFYHHYFRLERVYGWHARQDLGVPRPKLLFVHALLARIRHRLRRWILGPRALCLSE